MASISLRGYNREIENQINIGRYDEAIVHCRHILQYFPKHVNTYRLLGKAYLESQRYGDAADIFQRVLSSVPDDFIAQVGMSIIREDEGNLDAALWHMERAYEIQPANATIQEELRRLYGHRDGQEPPKIQLTRGALARIYAKGNLHTQAITELRAALSEDPQRPDLQVLLAQMYYVTGQQLEATEICNLILKKLPFCLMANQILAEILLNTERSTEAQTYLQRVHTLDPYAAYISAEAPTSDEVPDSAIMLEHLEWIPGQEIGEIPSQLDWAQSLGIKLDQITSKEEMPEWLSSSLPKVKPFEGIDETFLMEHGLTFEEKNILKTEPTKEVDMAKPEMPEEPQKPDEQIPDWLKSAGWEPARPSEGETVQPSEAKEELESADIPEWLKSLAPSESSQMETPEIPDWLMGLEAQPETSEPIPTAVEEDTSEQPEEKPTEGEEIEWISRPSETPAMESPMSGITSELGSEDAALAWLESLAAKQGVPEEELLTHPEERSETLPEWLQEMVRESEPISSIEVPTPSQSVELDKEPLDLKTFEETVEAKATPSEIPEWVSALGQEVVPEEEKPSAELEMPTPQAEIPDWLKEIMTEPTSVQQEERVDSAEAVISRSEAELIEFALADTQPMKITLEEETGEEQVIEQDLQPPAIPFETGIEVEQVREEIGESLVTEEYPSQELVREDLEEEIESLKEAEVQEEIKEAKIPEWLPEAEVEVTKAEVETLPSIEKEIEERPIEVPEWLKEFEKTETLAIAEEKEVIEEEVQIPQWLQMDQREVEKTVVETVEEAIQPVDINRASLAEIERLPGVGFILAQNILNHRETYGHFKDINELKNVYGIDEATYNDIQRWFTIEIEEVKPPVPESPEEITLNDARTAMESGETAKAVDLYNRLIQQEQFIKEIIKDLESAIYRYPMEIPIYITLGDALVRNNQLQAALEIYTKAEQLL